MTEKEARKQAKKEKEFYGHLAIYLLVNTFLIVVNIMSSTGHFWFIYPLLGWGMGLAGHASEVFGVPGFGRDWEERKVRELLGQEETQASIEGLRAELRRIERGAQHAPESELERLRRRIENLEAIVTSRDWDELNADYRRPALGLEAEAEAPEADAERAAQLARRVR